MRDHSLPSRLAAAGLLLLASLLGGCADTGGPAWGPNTPRNGADQPVNPIYGTPIPGYPTINGGRP